MIKFTRFVFENLIKAIFISPKKNLPRAVDRNKIKRRIRVALHKEKDLLVDSGFNRFLFIYLKEEVLSFGVVQKELAKLIRSL